MPRAGLFAEFRAHLVLGRLVLGLRLQKVRHRRLRGRRLGGVGGADEIEDRLLPCGQGRRVKRAFDGETGLTALDVGGRDLDRQLARQIGETGRETVTAAPEPDHGAQGEADPASLPRPVLPEGGVSGQVHLDRVIAVRDRDL